MGRLQRVSLKHKRKFNKTVTTQDWHWYQAFLLIFFKKTKYETLGVECFFVCLFCFFTMVDSSRLRMRKPCLFGSSSAGDSAFSSPSFCFSSFSFSPSSPSSPVSAPSSDSLLFSACRQKRQHLRLGQGGALKKKKKKRKQMQHKFGTFLSSLTSLEMTVHMSWQPGNSNVVTTWGRMLR